MKKAISFLRQWLGLEHQTEYVREHFFASNMRAGIYISGIMIILELWMIERMAAKVITEHIRGNEFWYLADRYFANYLTLLSTGILTMILALIYFTQKKWLRWFVLPVPLMCLSVCMLESSLIFKVLRNGVQSPELQNYIILFCASILLITFSIMLLVHGKLNRRQNMLVLYVFSFISVNFGIILSTHSYERGEQVLTFLTMVLFVSCMLVWKPIPGFLVLTVSYLLFYLRINPINAFNTGTPGITESTLINGLIMWISMLMLGIANYRKILAQAQKDESLEHMNHHLSDISTKDELTGIHNMLFFRQEAERILSYITTDLDNTVYLFLDIENFKSFNGKYGFHAGNELLITMAKLIERTFKGSLVARFSDDHFVVMTRDENAQELIAQIALELRKNQREVHLDLKCGAYKPAEGEIDPSLACDRARFACNSIKKHFDRRFQYYDKKLEDRHQLRQYIINSIDAAVENGWIRVFYQPVVSTKTGDICGLEALARWDDPQHGLLSPGVFIEVLEEYRQIHKLDCCVMEQVCRDYQESIEKGEPFVPVSLNFSRLDFELCDIVALLNELSERYQVPKEFLDVEITESALTAVKDFLPKAITSLREGGFQVWLDDFGSGYSSLNVLKDFQFDVLKIDMQFLSGFGSNKKTMPILKNIISLSQQLKMVSLTEGVETPEQFEFLRSIGCERVQGYLFGKPTPLPALRERIHKGELAISKEFH